jgi:hypothetical protein
VNRDLRLGEFRAKGKGGTGPAVEGGIATDSITFGNVRQHAGYGSPPAPARVRTRRRPELRKDGHTLALKIVPMSAGAFSGAII